MIPTATVRALGTSMPAGKYDPDEPYMVEGRLLNELRILTSRLFSEQRISADEMRDWANLLHLRLGDVVSPLE